MRLGFHHPLLDDEDLDPMPNGQGIVTQLSPAVEEQAERTWQERALDGLALAGHLTRDFGLGVGALVVAWQFARKVKC